MTKLTVTTVRTARGSLAQSLLSSTLKSMLQITDNKYKNPATLMPHSDHLTHTETGLSQGYVVKPFKGAVPHTTKPTLWYSWLGVCTSATV